MDKMNETVKVCDICGHAGWKDFLAVCCRCGVVTEHVYCMRITLEMLPDGNWMCEECVLLEYRDKMTKFDKFVACQKYKSSYQPCQGGEISKFSDVKVLPETNAKGLDLDKRGGDKISSLPSAKRTSGNLTCALMTKGIALGTENGPSFISRDCTKAPQAQDYTTKPRQHLSGPNNLSSRTRIIQENAALHTISGNLTKSKSFNGSDKRPKVQWLDEIPQKPKFSKKTRKKKNVCSILTMRKAL